MSLSCKLTASSVQELLHSSPAQLAQVELFVKTFVSDSLASLVYQYCYQSLYMALVRPWV